MVSSTFIPEWKKYEQDILSNDPEIARKSAEAFQKTREEELKNNPQARKWENDRLAEIRKNKPLAVKQRLVEEKYKYDQQIDKYLNGGIVMGKITMAPGFVLVKPIVIDKTKGGLYLPEGAVTEDVAEPPRGVVVAVGEDRIFPNGLISKPPCKVGDVVAFKWHTMVILYNNEKHHFMSNEDIFFTIED